MKLSESLSKAESHLDTIGESRISKRIQKLRSSLGQTQLRVAIFGEFNRGKSTLINALLGRVVLPAKLVPTTGHVTRIVFGLAEAARVRFIDGQERIYGLDRLDEFSTLSRTGHAREDVDSIELSVNCPLLQGDVAIIDTPGVCDREAQTRRARDAIALADVVLLVLDARQLLGDAEQDLAVGWLTGRLSKPVVPVLNFMNFVDEAERGQLRLRLDRWCRENLREEIGRPWFEVNALGALKHVQSGAAAPSDDYFGLRDAIACCSGDRRRSLQDRARMGQLGEEVRQARADNETVLRRLEADSAALMREREQERVGLTDRERHLTASSAVQRDKSMLAAGATLAASLDSLIAFWFRGESKDRLAANAATWYRNKLTDALREIEREAQQTLSSLAGGDLPRPQPLTLIEKMILDARLEVGDIAMIDASGTQVGWGVGLGAGFGTLLFPGLGTALGAAVGGWLANWLGSSEPDYPAAYSDKARVKWKEDADKALGHLRSELNARTNDMILHVGERLRDTPPVGATVEIAMRESLERVLARCERELRPQ